MPVPAAPAPVVTSTDYDEIVVDLGSSNATYQRNVAIRTGDQTTTDPSAGDIVATIPGTQTTYTFTELGDASPLQPDTQYTVSQRFIV